LYYFKIIVLNGKSASSDLNVGKLKTPYV